MAFEDLGYAASNELSPDAWKEHMLGNLAKQDQYQSQRLQQYIQLQARMRAKQKKDAAIAGIKEGLKFGIGQAMAPGVQPDPNAPAPFENQLPFYQEPGTFNPFGDQ